MRQPTPRFFATCLGGEKGPRRDVVLLNAGASLFVGGKAASVREGIERAAQAIDSGAAATKLDAMIAASKPVYRMTSTVADAGSARRHRRRDAADGRGASGAGAARGDGRRAAAVEPRPGRFTAALSRADRLNIIAECKRRSPSRGVLKADYDPAAIARGYDGQARRRFLC